MATTEEYRWQNLRERLGVPADPAVTERCAFCSFELSAPLEDRLSWHSLRHSFASLLATELELPATTLAELIGHADAGFTLRVHARDGRNESAVVNDVLARASAAKIGT